MSDCVKRLVEKSNGVFDAAEAKKLLKDVENIARAKERAGFDYDDAVKDTLAEYATNVKQNLEKQKINTLRNISKNQGMLKRIDDLVADGSTLTQAFRAEIEGTARNVRGGRYSADLQAESVKLAHIGSFMHELESENLLGVLNSKTMTKDIANELRILEDGAGVRSEIPQARRIAEIMNKHKEIMRQRLNRAGADIGETDGHTMLQTHEIYKLQKVGEEGWVNFIKPLIDTTKSFGGTENMDAALRGAYQALVTGIRLDNPLAQKDAKMFQFVGPANLGKKLSMSRQIHFKDANSFLKYNENFGKYDFNDALINMFVRNGHDVAVMERYGTNPKATIDAAVSTAGKKYRGDLAAEGERLDRHAITSMTDELLGRNLEPANPTLARWGSNIRLYQTVSKLGGVLLSSISDMPFKALEYQYQGKSILSSYAQTFADLAEGFKSKKEKTEFASLLGVGMEGMIGDISGRITGMDNASRVANKLSRTFFKLNGLSWWTDTHKLAMGKVLSHDLALKKDAGFAELGEATTRLFRQYGINEKDWNQIRKGVKTMEDGREYIFPEMVGDKAASEKLMGYFVDSANNGIITPGQKERRIATLGTQRGTPVGEATRLLMQFKQFPISMITKLWGRTLYSKGKLDVPAMLQLVVMTGVFGYLAGAAKDLVRGKNPKDPSKPETIAAAFAQGGGFSIAGDLVFGTRDLLASGAGPTATQANDLVKILQSARQGQDVQARAFKFMTDSTVPNLFYAKPAIDYLLLYQIQEELNPGYLNRMESQMKRDYGQTYWARPRDVVK